MKINDINVILNLYKTRSITRTADLLDYSPSNLYHIIADIEDELGYKMIEKGRGKILSFTDKGLIAIDQMLEISNCYNNMLHLKKDNTVVVGADTVINPILGLMMVTNFGLSSNTLNVELKYVGRHYEMSNFLKNGEIDLYFDYEWQESNFHFHKLGNDKLYLIGKNLPYSQNITINLLNGKTVMIDGQSSNLCSFLKSYSKKNDITINFIEIRNFGEINLNLGVNYDYYLTTSNFIYTIPSIFTKQEITDIKIPFGYYYKNSRPILKKFISNVQKYYNSITID